MTEQGTVPHQAAAGSDEQALLQRLREGEDAAFGELFELHAGAVRRLARNIASDQSEAEDITAETFFRVLQALRRGAGPRDYARAYLLTVARRVSWEWQGARRDVPVTDDELTSRAGAGADAHARSAEHTLITTAFTSLPERWRSVLWQTEVEGEQPAMVAPHFGLSANATAALARRARQGLRAAYLQAHLSVSRSSDGCRAVVEKLGSYTAGGVTGGEARRIRAHLLGCSSCQSTHDELRDVCSSLRAHAGVLLVAVPAAGFGAGSSAGGVAVKSFLFGSKVKVALALASTAAAGAFGIVVGPAVVSPDSTQTIGLPGGGSPELSIVEPAPPVPEQPQVAVGTGQFTVHAPGPAGNGVHAVRRGIEPGVAFGGAANEVSTSAIALSPPAAALPGPAVVPDIPQPVVTATSSSPAPRIDTTTSSPTPRIDTTTSTPGPTVTPTTTSTTPGAGHPPVSNTPSPPDCSTTSAPVFAPSETIKTTSNPAPNSTKSASAHGDKRRSAAFNTPPRRGAIP
jgi:RNA polymerase sigma factor (sigma-70 family)